MERATAISVRATRSFIRAVNTLAEDKGTTTADMVKAAILEKFGKELEPYIEAFSALSGEYVNHSVSSITEGQSDAK